ncbi:hypothetical protein HK105_207949 [Polyrhizophydium stewartii]|uniref:C2H2-type domain-containing protein n=1 Tax=Polyrhizophydium stewartii TaxID=2732419 RepID=A0ABR4MZ75_9FUNG
MLRNAAPAERTVHAAAAPAPAAAGVHAHAARRGAAATAGDSPASAALAIPADADADADALACLWVDAAQPRALGGDVCGAMFASPDDLHAHVSATHIGRKVENTLCLECRWLDCTLDARQFSKRDHIVSHIKKHMPLKAFVCATCNRSYKWIHDYRKHQAKTGHGDPDATPALSSASSASAQSTPRCTAIQPPIAGDVADAPFSAEVGPCAAASPDPRCALFGLAPPLDSEMASPAAAGAAGSPARAGLEPHPALAIDALVGNTLVHSAASVPALLHADAHASDAPLAAAAAASLPLLGPQAAAARASAFRRRRRSTRPYDRRPTCAQSLRPDAGSAPMHGGDDSQDVTDADMDGGVDTDANMDDADDADYELGSGMVGEDTGGAGASGVAPLTHPPQGPAPLPHQALQHELQNDPAPLAIDSAALSLAIALSLQSQIDAEHNARQGDQQTPATAVPHIPSQPAPAAQHTASSSAGVIDPLLLFKEFANDMWLPFGAPLSNTVVPPLPLPQPRTQSLSLLEHAATTVQHAAGTSALAQTHPTQIQPALAVNFPSLPPAFVGRSDSLLPPQLTHQPPLTAGMGQPSMHHPFAQESLAISLSLPINMGMTLPPHMEMQMSLAHAQPQIQLPLAHERPALGPARIGQHGLDLHMPSASGLLGGGTTTPSTLLDGLLDPSFSAPDFATLQNWNPIAPGAPHHHQQLAADILSLAAAAGMRRSESAAESSSSHCNDFMERQEHVP